MNFSKKVIIYTTYASWCGLGFIRGVKAYKYNHKKNKKNENYLYVDLCIIGVCGIITYGNIFFLPFSIYKELYRLEVNIKNLQNEKNTDYYNQLSLW